MPSKPGSVAGIPLVYWDACVFIDYLQKDKAYRLAEIVPLVHMAQNNKLHIVTSAISLGEVLRLPDPTLNDDEIDHKIVEFFKNPWITVRAADTNIMGMARRLRRATVLSKPNKSPHERTFRLPDAIHIATALYNNVLAMHSYDDTDLVRRNGLLSLDGKTFLKIIHPEDPTPPKPMPLFDPPC